MKEKCKNLNKTYKPKKQSKISENDNNQNLESNYIIGRNSVMEAIKSSRPIDSLFVEDGRKSGSLIEIISICKEKKIPVKEVSIKKLDAMCDHANHQGVIAVSAAYAYSTLDDIFDLAKKRDEVPFIIIADGIEDPHNLGAIIRTAECAGVHGVIIPSRRAVGLNFTVGKISAGALEHVPVVRVTNLSSTVEELKERGLWIYGAEADGSDLYKTSLKGPIALVIGSEGKGISRLLKEKCDGIVSLQLKGKITSLNASVAAGVLMYEIVRKRSI